MTEKSCYDCKLFEYCRLRDRAKDLGEYQNKTGNLIGSGFQASLYSLMGKTCKGYCINAKLSL